MPMECQDFFFWKVKGDREERRKARNSVILHWPETLGIAVENVSFIYFFHLKNIFDCIDCDEILLL